MGPKKFYFCGMLSRDLGNTLEQTTKNIIEKLADTVLDVCDLLVKEINFVPFHLEYSAVTSTIQNTVQSIKFNLLSTLYLFVNFLLFQQYFNWVTIEV